MIEVEVTVSGERIERERTRPGLAQADGRGGETGQTTRGIHNQGLAGDDVDITRRVEPAVDDNAVRRESVRDTQHTRVGAVDAAGITGPDGNRPVGDHVAQLGVGRDVDGAREDVELGVAIVALQDQRAVTRLGQSTARDITRGRLRHRAVEADRDGGGGVIQRPGRENRDIVTEGDIAVVGGERATVEEHMRGRRQGRRATEVQDTLIDLGEAGVGVRALEIDDARTGLDEVIKAAAGAVLDSAIEDDAGIRIVRGERTGGTRGTAVAIIREADGARERQVGVSASVSIKGDIAHHQDVVRDDDILGRTPQAQVLVLAEGATIEDQPALPERGVVGDFQTGVLIHEQITREIIRGVEGHPAVATLDADRLCLHTVAQDANLHGGRPGEDCRVQGEITRTTADAVRVAGTDAQAGGGIRGPLAILPSFPTGPEEELTVQGSRREIDGGAETHDVDTDDAIEIRGRARPSDVRERTDIFQAEHADTGAIRFDGDAARRDVVRRSETDVGTRQDGDSSRAESLAGSTRHADHGFQQTFTHRDSRRVSRAGGTQGNFALAPLHQRTRTGDGAMNVNGRTSVGDFITEGNRAQQIQAVEINRTVIRRVVDDRRIEIVVRIRVDGQLIVDRVVTTQDGIAVHHHLGLVVNLIFRVDLRAVQDDFIALGIRIIWVATEGPLIVQAEPVVAADDHITGERTTIVAANEHIDAACLRDASGNNLTVVIKSAIRTIVGAVDEELTATRYHDVGSRSLVRIVESLDHTAARKRQRVGRRQGHARTRDAGLKANGEARAVDDRGNDRPGRDTRARDRLADHKVGRRGSSGDGIRTNGERTRKGRRRRRRQSAIDAESVNVQIGTQGAARTRPNGGGAAGQTGGDTRHLHLVSDLTAEWHRIGKQWLQAERGALVGQEGVVRLVDHPRRGHPGGGAGTSEGRASVRGEGRRGDAQATIGRGGVQRARVRGEEEHPAIRAAEDVRNFEDVVTRVDTLDLNGARTPETHGDGADFFVRI